MKVRSLHMENDMESCDLRRQLAYSYHLITKFPCHLWEATQANVSSHLIMKRKNRQNVLEKQTALITPLRCSLGIRKKSIVHASYLYKEGSHRYLPKKKKKVRMNALVTPACPVGSENRCMGKLEGKKSCEKQTCLGNE